jgi:hypothetical protein
VELRTTRLSRSHRDILRQGVPGSDGLIGPLNCLWARDVAETPDAVTDRYNSHDVTFYTVDNAIVVHDKLAMVADVGFLKWTAHPEERLEHLSRGVNVINQAPRRFWGNTREVSED